jgi:hypothetical protein
MDAEKMKDVEHLLDDQTANIRRTYEEAIKVGFKDCVIWLFNLELEDSREVAISPDFRRSQNDIFDRLRGKLKVQERGDRRKAIGFERQATRLIVWSETRL